MTPRDECPEGGGQFRDGRPLLASEDGCRRCGRRLYVRPRALIVASAAASAAPTASASPGAATTASADSASAESASAGCASSEPAAASAGCAAWSTRSASAGCTSAGPASAGCAARSTRCTSAGCTSAGPASAGSARSTRSAGMVRSARPTRSASAGSARSTRSAGMVRAARPTRLARVISRCAGSSQWQRGVVIGSLPLNVTGVRVPIRTPCRVPEITRAPLRERPRSSLSLTGGSQAGQSQARGHHGCCCGETREVFHGAVFT
jgi:hypothetical protein